MVSPGNFEIVQSSWTLLKQFRSICAKDPDIKGSTLQQLPHFESVWEKLVLSREKNY